MFLLILPLMGLLADYDELRHAAARPVSFLIAKVLGAMAVAALGTSGLFFKTMIRPTHIVSLYVKGDFDCLYCQKR